MALAFQRARQQRRRQRLRIVCEDTAVVLEQHRGLDIRLRLERAKYLLGNRPIFESQRRGAVVRDNRCQGGEIAHQPGSEGDCFVGDECSGGHEQYDDAREQDNRSHTTLYGSLPL